MDSHACVQEMSFEGLDHIVALVYMVAVIAGAYQVTAFQGWQ